MSGSQGSGFRGRVEGVGEIPKTPIRQCLLNFRTREEFRIAKRPPKTRKEADGEPRRDAE